MYRSLKLFTLLLLLISVGCGVAQTRNAAATLTPAVALAPARPGEEHGSTAVDRNTPKLPDGTPVLAPFWQAMCFDKGSNQVINLPLLRL